MSESEPQPDLNGIRQSIRELRRAIPQTDRLAASQSITETFLRLETFQSAQKIAGFLAFDGEADPLPLMTWAAERKRQIFVPVVIGKQSPLVFSPWHPADPLKSNSFGIAEPDLPEERRVDPQELDFVIAPLVAFDQNCHRLGVGGGYYDRSFAFLNSQAPGPSRRPKLVGFAFDFQRVEKIIRKPWDVPLDAVVTERQVYFRTSDDGKNS